MRRVSKSEIRSAELLLTIYEIKKGLTKLEIWVVFLKKCM